jgi:CDGSH-type Zn-finger protein
MTDRSAEGTATGQVGTVVTVYENGPLIMRGDFTVTAQDGRPIPAGRRTVAFCRCGRSAIRPFCDGTHTRIGFRAPGGAQRPRAVERDPDEDRGSE